MTTYYTASISHLTSTEFWKDWLDEVPDNISSNDPDFCLLGLMQGNYMFVAEDDGQCKGLGVDNDLLEEDSNDNDEEIILSWDDLNTAIMGE